jgi:hypothetical protein
MFGLTGLLAGLGYMIREVSAQLVAYGAIWLACQLFKPTKLRSRSRTIATAILLFSGFLIAAGPYMITRGAVLPPRVKYLIDSICSHRPAQPRGEQNPAARDRHENEYLAGYSQSTVHALYNIYKRIGESLIWVFAVPWLIGIFHHFRHCRETKGKFLMSLFICANIIFLVIRGSHFNKAVSTRYVLPLVAFTICYVPTGLEILSHFLSRIGRGSTSSPPQGQRWFYTLLIAGLCICLPKLVRPIGCDKQGYRDAADWLTKYATETDIVIVPDRRISFYAQRKGYLNANRVLKRAAYALIITENENEPLNLARAAQKVYSVTVDKRKKKGRKIVVYKML